MGLKAVVSCAVAGTRRLDRFAPRPPRAEDRSLPGACCTALLPLLLLTYFILISLQSLTETSQAVALVESANALHTVYLQCVASAGCRVSWAVDWASAYCARAVPLAMAHEVRALVRRAGPRNSSAVHVQLQSNDTMRVPLCYSDGSLDGLLVELRQPPPGSAEEEVRTLRYLITRGPERYTQHGGGGALASVGADTGGPSQQDTLSGTSRGSGETAEQPPPVYGTLPGLNRQRRTVVAFTQTRLIDVPRSTERHLWQMQVIDASGLHLPCALVPFPEVCTAFLLRPAFSGQVLRTQYATSWFQLQDRLGGFFALAALASSLLIGIYVSSTRTLLSGTKTPAGEEKGIGAAGEGSEGADEEDEEGDAGDVYTVPRETTTDCTERTEVPLMLIGGAVPPPSPGAADEPTLCGGGAAGA